MVDTHAKIRLTGGSDFWHTPAIEEADLPELMWTDGPHGVRKQVASSDHLGIDASEPAFEPLWQATLTRTRVRFTYHDLERVVEPWALVYRKGAWYLLALDQEWLGEGR